MNVNQIIRHCKGLGLYELMDYAGENYQTVFGYIKSIRNDVNPNHILVGTIYTCIACNGKLAEKEWDFIVSFIGGITYDEAHETASSFYNDEAENTARELVGVFPYDIKEAYVKLCIAVLCVDGNVDNLENTFLNSLLSEF